MSTAGTVETSGRILAGLREGRVSLARHRALHPAPPELDLAALVAELEAVGLVGRGGAAFPVARKLAATSPGRSTTVVVNGSEIHASPAHPVARVVDVTGAGDLFAAGFLYGVTNGKSLPEAARIGSMAAAEVISHIGARPEVALRAEAKRLGLL